MLLLPLGCAMYQDVRVTSDPSGAEVFLDRVKLGETPLEIRVMRDRDHSVFVKKDGYRSELVVLTLRSAQDGRAFLTPADLFVELFQGGGLPDARDVEQSGAKDKDPAEGGRPRGRSGRDRDVQIQPEPASGSPGNRAGGRSTP